MMRWLAGAALLVACGATAPAPATTSAPGGTTPPSSGLPVSIPPGPYLSGRSYTGRAGYVEYLAGDVPIVVSAPHGGNLLPAEIPDRTDAACGGSATTATDLNTRELALAVQARWHARFGTRPHVVLLHLSRRKLDANRPALEAACGDAEAQIALTEWHLFLEAAVRAALASSPTAPARGWYMDLHGHGHAVQRLELGYLLSGAQLDLADAALDADHALRDTASIRTLAEERNTPLSVVLRGPSSLGTLYGAEGFPAVPSAGDPGPRGAPYFSGGDGTRRYACGAESAPFGALAGGRMCGVQIEANFTGVRDTEANRDRFGDATAVVLEKFFAANWPMK